MKKILLLFIAAFLLTSCATTPPQAISQDKNLDWGTRVNTLSEIQTWDLKALISMRQRDQRADAWSATLQWRQTGHSYHIALFGPLGSHHYELTGTPGNVQLATANGKIFTAKTPEALLRDQTGSEVPVSNLYYWIRGLPVPNIPAQKQFDAYHHLVLLKQQDWVIQYLRYTAVNNIDIPNKIFLENPQLNVKILINQWQF